MALKADYKRIRTYGFYDGFLNDTIEKEVVFPSAYIRVHSVGGDKKNMSFIVRVFSDGNPVDQRNFEFSPSVADDSVNFIKQAYEYLKTLPEFKNAEDC